MNAFSELIGKTLTECTGEKGGEEMLFKTACGKTYRLFHEQDCCESVNIADIAGDLHDLIGSPILKAEESSSTDEPPDEDDCGTHTWTFYKLATIKGYVDVRWLGQSNGYYSESVDFEEVAP